ncbi:hypothetical protein GCM10028812_49680 [Ancylobacter sonchi]
MSNPLKIRGFTTLAAANVASPPRALTGGRNKSWQLPTFYRSDSEAPFPIADRRHSGKVGTCQHVGNQIARQASFDNLSTPPSLAPIPERVPATERTV